MLTRVTNGKQQKLQRIHWTANKLDVKKAPAKRQAIHQIMHVVVPSKGRFIKQRALLAAEQLIFVRKRHERKTDIKNCAPQDIYSFMGLIAKINNPPELYFTDFSFFSLNW